MSNYSDKEIERIHAIAKKLHALAERGVDGEKANAEKVLAAFLKKHNLKLDDLLGEQKTRRWFKVSKTKDKFFHQVAASVLGVKFSTFTRPSLKGMVGIDLTAEEFVEVESRFDFYWRAYQEDLEVFYSAFIQRNKLYAKPSDDELREDSEEKPLSLEQKQKLFKTQMMMQGIERRTHRKQLES